MKVEEDEDEDELDDGDDDDDNDSAAQEIDGVRHQMWWSGVLATQRLSPIRNLRSSSSSPCVVAGRYIAPN